MNEYRGKHVQSAPWPVASTASSPRHSRHSVRNRRRKKYLIALLILLALLVAWPFVDAQIIRIDRVSFTSEDLSPDIGRIRIVFVSDIHYGFFCSDAHINSLVGKINSLRPDLVLFGGDYATDNAGAVTFFKNLPSVRARYATLGVIGESDRGDSDIDLDMLTESMRESGVIPLINSVNRIPFGNSFIYIAGLDDYLTGTPDLTSLGKQVSAGDFVILISHNPSIIPNAQNTLDKSGRYGWFDLALFGHTHGGQILPFRSVLDIGGSDITDRYLSGWYEENKTHILVSNGVGTSIIPARMFCPPQIHCIDISIP